MKKFLILIPRVPGSAGENLCEKKASGITVKTVLKKVVPPILIDAQKYLRNRQYYIPISQRPLLMTNYQQYGQLGKTQLSIRVK